MHVFIRSDKDWVNWLANISHLISNNLAIPGRKRLADRPLFFVRRIARVYSIVLLKCFEKTYSDAWQTYLYFVHRINELVYPVFMESCFQCLIGMFPSYYTTCSYSFDDDYAPVEAFALALSNCSSIDFKGKALSTILNGLISCVEHSSCMIPQKPSSSAV
jgi:hypothetical protein